MSGPGSKVPLTALYFFLNLYYNASLNFSLKAAIRKLKVGALSGPKLKLKSGTTSAF